MLDGVVSSTVWVRDLAARNAAIEPSFCAASPRPTHGSMRAISGSVIRAQHRPSETTVSRLLKIVRHSGGELSNRF